MGTNCLPSTRLRLASDKRGCYRWGVALMTSRNYLRALALFFGALWIRLAYQTVAPGGLVVENVLVASFIGLLVAMRRSFHFSLFFLGHVDLRVLLPAHPWRTLHLRGGAV